MINILLVDDHPSVGEGTKSMIEQEDDMAVTVISSGAQALNEIQDNTYDIYLFDMNMPDLNGLELTRKIRPIDSDTPILIYTGYDISPHFNVLVEAGISGFIGKTVSREQLIVALRCALRGEVIIPIPLFRQLRRKEIRVGSRIGAPVEEVSINEREQLILQEIARGKSNKEVAETLMVSQRTVEYNLTHIFGKFNVRSRAEAILEARRLAIICDDLF